MRKALLAAILAASAACVVACSGSAGPDRPGSAGRAIIAAEHAVTGHVRIAGGKSITFPAFDRQPVDFDDEKGWWRVRGFADVDGQRVAYDVSVKFDGEQPHVSRCIIAGVEMPETGP